MKNCDVFLSYAREDRAFAEELAKHILSLGWTVWWDRELLPGQDFDQTIEQRLDDAKAVIVLWSKSSRQSEWVRSEARHARSRKVLLPIQIEAGSPPLEFNGVHTANLIDWGSDRQSPEFATLLRALELLAPRSIVPLENRAAPLLPGARQRWNQQRFREVLATSEMPGPARELGHFLLSLVDGSDIVGSYGTGKNGSLTLKRNQRGFIEFYLSGSIGFRRDGFEVALGPIAAAHYRSAIDGMFGGGQLWGPRIEPDVVARYASRVTAAIQQALDEARRS
jgi:hypothetical protein